VAGGEILGFLRGIGVFGVVFRWWFVVNSVVLMVMFSVLKNAPRWGSIFFGYSRNGTGRGLGVLGTPLG
jgi:hypothetical protein